VPNVPTPRRRTRVGRRSSQRGVSTWWLLPAALVVAWLLWPRTDSPHAAQPAAQSVAAWSAPAASPFATVRSESAAEGTAPFSKEGLQARQAQLALWKQRLERAQSTLEAYRLTTRYPHESRPISEHVDQIYPNKEVTEEVPLAVSGGKAAEGVTLRTTQERVFVQGNEGVHFSVSLRDSDGNALPLRVLRAFAAEMPPPRSASLYPQVPIAFNDEGRDGDAAAGDGVYGARLHPATQGFAELFGRIRMEVHLQFQNQQGITYFDVMYTPAAPATWEGGVREALEDGSLNFYLKANVQQSGRYVVTGRIDDAQGKPFALLTFNDEVGAGPQEFKLTLFGKLIRDGQPAFPLVLRDVDAFLLRPNASPDRSLMPRLPGQVHMSQTHAPESFSNAEWNSEERTRYLRELGRDVATARARTEQLSR
jgi:hypothetical protein